MPPTASNAPPPFAARLRIHAVALWLAVVLGAWTAAHGLNISFGIAARCSEGQRFVWWTGAKVVAWLVPTAMLAHLTAAEPPARWLGLSTWEGMGRAFVFSALWLTLQVLGVQSGLALFEVPPSEPRWPDLPGALLIAPLFEELMFRGVMLRTLRDRGTEREPTVLWSALAFAALHLPGWLARRGFDPGIAGSFFGIAAFGLVLGYLAWYARSLWAPVLLHALHNAWSTGLIAWSMQS